MLSSFKFSWLHARSVELILDRATRRADAERQIRQLAHTSNLLPSSHVATNQQWASDGSMVPAAAGLFDK
jgi:hypothetical protein